MTGAKRKTGDPSDTNKTKLGNSNVDQSPHPSQENMSIHILLLCSQQNVAEHEERLVCVPCLKTLAADSMQPDKFKRHLETLHPTRVSKPLEFFKESICNLTATHGFEK